MIKIYYDLENERKLEKEIVEAILKGKKSLIDVFDKAYFIEKLWENATIGKPLIIKFDEEKGNNSNIMSSFKPARMIINDNSNIIPVQEYFKRFEKDDYNITVSFKNNEYLLTIKKTKDTKLDLKLKIDHDRTIELSKLIKDAKGIRTYYLIRKDEM